MRAPVVTAVVVLLLAVGTWGALSAGDAGTGGTLVRERPGDVAPEPVAKAVRARAAAAGDDAAPAQPAPPPTDADITPIAPGEATGDGFPPFEHRGGPLLVRSSPQGAALLDPLGDDVWRPFLPPNGSHTQAVLAPGRVLVSVTHCQSGVEAEAHGWPTRLEIADTSRGALELIFGDDVVSFLATRGSSVIVLETKRRRLLRATVAPGATDAPAARVELDTLGDVDRIVALVESCAFVTTRGDDRLVRVPFDGSPARRTEVRAGDGNVLPSPNGRLIAVASSMPWRAADDPAATPAIRVIDADDDRETLRVAHIGIDPRIGLLSHGVPQIEAAWADDRRVRWTDFRDPPDPDVAPPVDELTAERAVESPHRWVEVDARTGERLATVTLPAGLPYGHTAPPTTPVLAAPTPSAPTGRFTIRGDEVFFDGPVERTVERTVARATWAPGAMLGQFLSVSPDGRFAVVCVTEGKRRLVVLLDGETHAHRIVHRAADTPQACGGDTHFSWLALR